MRMKQLNKTQFEVLRFIQDQNLIKPGDSVCVCFSGGPDSAVLLHILFHLRDRIPFQLSACHLNHGIRGLNADRDEAFCRAQAVRYGIPFFSKKEDVPALAEARGLSLEEAGRFARYDWFRTLASEFGISAFATGHQKNDVAETVLYRMIRGTTVDGLSGIPAKRDFYIRPILFLCREDVLLYAKQNDVSYVEDETNRNADYVRNRIRLSLIPLLEEMNPRVVDAIGRLAEYSSQDSSLIESLMPTPDPDTDFRTWPDAFLQRAVSDLFEEKAGGTLCHYHIRPICSALRSGSDATIELPDGWQAVCTEGKLSIQKAASSEEPVPFDLELADGCQILPTGCSIEYSRPDSEEPASRKIVHNLSTEIYLRTDGIHGTIRCRNRLPGDAIREFGLTKRIKKLFNERKIQPELRSMIPVVYDDDGILCVPFVATADRVFSKHPGGCVRLSVSLNPREEGECL